VRFFFAFFGGFERDRDISTIDQRFHGFRVADNSGVDGDKPVSVQ